MRAIDIFADIKKELQELETGLKQVLDSQDHLVADISSHLLSSAGKRLRPALFFLCAKLKGEDIEDIKDIMSVAVAIELIHSATLVHDDVVDNSNSRRGIPSVNSKWGNQSSVLMGDYLFAKAFALLTNFGYMSLINVMSEVVEKMSEGEIQQLNEVYSPDITEEIYLDRVKKKTALFISSSCKSGGIVSGVNELEVKSLQNYGYNLGIAFQIIDDLLDFLGDEKNTGKPVGNDLRHGTITLPVIYMLNSSDMSDIFKAKIRERNINEEFIKQVARQINETKAFDRAYNLAEKYVSQAVIELEVFPDSPHKRTLEFIAKFILKRCY